MKRGMVTRERRKGVAIEGATASSKGENGRTYGDMGAAEKAPWVSSATAWSVSQLVFCRCECERLHSCRMRVHRKNLVSCV